jgi:hypothetical protein
VQRAVPLWIKPEVGASGKHVRCSPECRAIIVVRRGTSAASSITDRVRMAKDLFQLRRAHSRIGAASFRGGPLRPLPVGLGRFR